MAYSPTSGPTPSGNAVLVEATGEHVLHSHHYHGALLRALFEAQGIDPAVILQDAVEACASGLAAPPPPPGDLAWLCDRLRISGLGRLERPVLDPRGNGKLVVHASHFAAAWRARFAAASRPVCAVTAGLLAKLLSESTGRPLQVVERECAAAGASACVFDSVAATSGSAPSPVGGGIALTPPHFPRIPLLGGSLEADADGVIAAPGGPFAAFPAEFYATLCRRFEVEVPRLRGAKFASLPGIMLAESAHWNGYQLFGAILRSPGWHDSALVRGEDEGARLQALLEVPALLGWGEWEATSFVAGERLIVRIHASYEAVGHERLFGRAGEPRCVVARGAAAAVMNLLYRDTPASAAAPLDATRYNTLFRSPHTFRAVETRCLAQGERFCELVVNPLTV